MVATIAARLFNHMYKIQPFHNNVLRHQSRDSVSFAAEKSSEADCEV